MCKIRKKLDLILKISYGLQVISLQTTSKMQNPEELHVLKNKIKKLRTLRGFSQEQMAEALNISLKSYANIENEKQDIGFGKLLKIAHILEMNVADLVGFDERIIFNNQESTISNSILNNMYSTVSTAESLYEKILAKKDRNIEKQVANLQATVHKLLENSTSKEV